MRALRPALAALIVGGCAIHPEALSVTELSEYAADKQWRVGVDQEPVEGSVGLYEAMARALKYNLDHHVELMEVSAPSKAARCRALFSVARFDCEYGLRGPKQLLRRP